MTFHSSWSQSDSFSYNYNSIWASVSTFLQEQFSPYSFNDIWELSHISLCRFQCTFSIQIEFNLTSSMYYNISTSTFELMKQVYIRTSVFVSFENYPIFNIVDRKLVDVEFYQNISLKQECIPEGCVPHAHWPHVIGVCVWQGACVAGGHVWQGGSLSCTTSATYAASLWTEWQTRVKTYLVWGQ